MSRYSLAIRGEMSHSRSVLQDYRHEDNELFSLLMDEQIVHWFGSRPADLVPSTGRSQHSSIRVLIAALDIETHIEDTRRKLSSGFGLVVDTCDISTQVVSLALLKKYDCVLFWTRVHGHLADASLDVDMDVIGDAFASFIDDGGVVVACYQTVTPAGRWASSSVLPFTITSHTVFTADSSSSLESPALVGVRALGGPCRVMAGTVLAGKKSTVCCACSKFDLIIMINHKFPFFLFCFVLFCLLFLVVQCP